MQHQSHSPVHPADIHHPAHPANIAAQQRISSSGYPMHQGDHPMQHQGSPHHIDHSQLMARHPMVAHGGQVPRHPKKKHRKNRPQGEAGPGPMPGPMAGPQPDMGFEQDVPPIQAPVPIDYRHELMPTYIRDLAFGPGHQWQGRSQVAGGFMQHTMPKPRFPNVHGFVPRQRDNKGWGGQGANGHQRGVIQGYANWNAHYH